MTNDFPPLHRDRLSFRATAEYLQGKITTGGLVEYRPPDLQHHQPQDDASLSRHAIKDRRQDAREDNERGNSLPRWRRVHRPQLTR